MKKLVSILVLVSIMLCFSMTPALAYEENITKDDLETGLWLYSYITWGQRFTVTDTQITRLLSDYYTETSTEESCTNYDLSNNPIFYAESTITPESSFKELYTTNMNNIAPLVYGLVGIYAGTFTVSHGLTMDNIRTIGDTDPELAEQIEHDIDTQLTSEDYIKEIRGLSNPKICEFVDFSFDRIGFVDHRTDIYNNNQEYLIVENGGERKRIDIDDFNFDDFVNTVYGDGIIITNDEFTYTITKTANTDGSYTIKSKLEIEKSADFSTPNNNLRVVTPDIVVPPDKPEIIEDQTTTEENNTEKTDTTVAPTRLANTGDSKILFVVIGLIMISVFVIGKKSKEYKDIK